MLDAFRGLQVNRTEDLFGLLSGLGGLANKPCPVRCWATGSMLSAGILRAFSAKAHTHVAMVFRQQPTVRGATRISSYQFETQNTPTGIDSFTGCSGVLFCCGRLGSSRSNVFFKEPLLAPTEITS